MNSEVTLINYSSSSPPMTKGQTRLIFKRNDPHHALLYSEDDIPRYYLTTSDGFSKVKICDEAQRTVVEVNRRMFLHDVMLFADRNDHKSIKVADVLKQASTTSDGQLSMDLHTEEGTYRWRKWRSHTWALYEQPSYTPVAWTETIPGSPPTWALVVESQALNILDYILASLFYLKASTDCPESGKGWENVDSHAVSLLTKQ